ncbi:MAG: universal stress protein, partial [Candidatus Thorarchaeota archaeon]
MIFFLYNKVLIAVEDSKESIKVIRKAIQLLENRLGMAIVFHSIKTEFDPLILPIIGYNSFYLKEFSSYNLKIKERRRAEKLLKNIEAIFSEYSIPVETRLIENKDPKDFIQEVIRNEDVDLIILACKGQHSKLRRIFLETLPQKI